MQLRSLLFGLLLPLLLLPDSISAQEGRRLDGTIEGSGSAFTIAVPSARYRGVSESLATELAQTVRDDLDFSGFFDLVDPGLYSLVPASSGDEERHEDWLSIGADAFLRLIVELKNDKVYLEARLHDNQTRQITFNRIYRGSDDFVRRLARALASDPQDGETDLDPAPALRDLEAALERLGRRACLRGRLLACPLESICPRRP